MTLIAHLSDPHFGTEQEHVANALVKLLHDRTPDLLILSGDITQRARRSQFSAAQDFFSRIPVPVQSVLAVPGNHDIPLFNLFARVFRPYDNYRRAFGSNLEPLLRSADVLAIGVNTTRSYRHVDGELSSEQIRRVSQMLREGSPRQLKIVVTHQPVYVIDPEERKNLVAGHTSAIYEWTDAGVDCVLGGHIHLPYLVPLHERVRSLKRRAWAIQAGTALSTRIRSNAGNSINMLDYSPMNYECAVERWDYCTSRRSFTQRNRHCLKLHRYGST